MIYNTPGPVVRDCSTLAYQELGTTIVHLGTCNIDLITKLPNAHQEVIWLDVMMYEVAKYKPGTAPAGLKQLSMAYQSK